MKEVKLTQEQLERVVSTAVKKLMTEEAALKLDYYEQSELEELVEMARLNKDNGGNTPFPSNVYEVKMWSNDHEPPHFHIINNQEDWEVTADLDGNILAVKRQSKKMNIQQIEKMCKEWLSQKNKYGTTNRVLAVQSWDVIH